MGKPKRNRYPSFVGLSPSSAISSKAKRANRATNTLPEIELCAVLRREGLRFRTHSASVPGRPDLVFSSAKLAVFCDGDFWHGRNWRKLKLLLQRRANAEYWVEKIAANRRRDTRVTRELEQAGWRVLRFWESEIRCDPQLATCLIKDELARISATMTHHSTRS